VFNKGEDMNPATTEDVVVDDDVNNVKEERAIDVMMRRNELMHTEKSIRNGREFVVKENDVFVATYPKSGTTWMQQIMHQIRCLREDRFAERAAMDFGEITEVVPWDILAEDCRGLSTIGGAQDLRAEQSKYRNGLRVFKSHEERRNIAKMKENGKMARYCIVTRNPEDVFYSFWKFLPEYCGVDSESVSAEEFCEAVFAGASHSGQYWNWNLEWFKFAREHKERCLFVCFEDMKNDLRKVILKIANFMGEDFVSKSDLDELVRRCSFEYMREHATQFDDHFVRNKVKKRMGIYDDGDDAKKFLVGKVRQSGGKIGDGKQNLPDSVKNRLEQRWNEVFASEREDEGLIFATYDDFREAINDIWWS